MKFLTRLRVAVAVILLAIVIVALAVYLATPPAPTSPTPTPSPYMPPLAPVWVEINSSHGFDQAIGDRHFVLSRGKSATLTMILTSTANQTLHLTPSVRETPVGVTAQFDSEFLTLEPNKLVRVKVTITVSATAPTSTPKPTPTAETLTPGYPEPTPPSTPILTPTPEIPWDWVDLIFTIQEEGYRFKTISEGFQLTIV